MSDTFELELLAEMPNYYDWIMEIFAPYVSGHTVEYGAGTGTISRRLASLADTLTLVEPLAELAALLRARFEQDGAVEVIHDTLEQHARTSGVAMADTIVMVNVLEHIENDRQTLVDVLQLLRPNGSLLILVPALQLLMSKIDRKFGHYRRYHRTDLLRDVTEAGGHVHLCRYFDFIGVAPWFLLNKLMGAISFNPRFVHIHDRFVVPISRLAERFIVPPIGKNLILIARKR